MEDNPDEIATRQKRIAINARVSGAVGDLFDAGGKRKHRLRLNGTVLSAVGSKQYEVLFDDNITRIVFSNNLRVESSIRSLPPDLRPSNTSPAADENDHSDTEHLPPDPSHDTDSGEDDSKPDVDAGEEEEAEVSLPVGALPTHMMVKNRMKNQFYPHYITVTILNCKNMILIIYIYIYLAKMP